MRQFQNETSFSHLLSWEVEEASLKTTGDCETVIHYTKDNDFYNMLLLLESDIRAYSKQKWKTGKYLLFN